ALDHFGHAVDLDNFFFEGQPRRADLFNSGHLVTPPALLGSGGWGLRSGGERWAAAVERVSDLGQCRSRKAFPQSPIPKPHSPCERSEHQNSSPASRAASARALTRPW